MHVFRLVVLYFKLAVIRLQHGENLEDLRCQDSFVGEVSRAPWPFIDAESFY